MPEQQHWPDALWLVRHGESAGNVARDAAEEEGLARIDIDTRDMDVPLSELGERQAAALGRWIGRQPPDERPTVVLSSPYVRAEDTAKQALLAAGIDLDDVELVVDERLREREFGILDRLTKAGIQEHHPQQAEHRAFLGKFYHRPPGGESWCDVVLRLRAVVDTITRDYACERVMIVSHQVVVLMFRYLLERLTEHEVLTIDREHEVANCSLTRYDYDPSAGRRGGMVLRDFNLTTPVEDSGEEVTEEPDVAVGAR